MIEVYFPPSVPFDRKYVIGNLYWRFKRNEENEYLGIAQQIFAQAMGWA